MSTETGTMTTHSSTPVAIEPSAGFWVRYGELWRKLINDVACEGLLWPQLDLHIAQMLVLGALNWAVEWWNPRRGSIESVVRNAQLIIRHGLTDGATA